MQVPSLLNDLFSGLYGLLVGVLGAGLPPPVVQVVITFIGIGFVLTFIALLVMLMVWTERRVIARIQDRVGPNRVGPFGLLQSVADVLKLLLKEDTVPGGADRVVFALAPLVVLVPSLTVFAVLPWNWDAVFARLDVGILFVLALATIPTIGVVMAGWASNNKYTLLGGMRAAAQLISYEVPSVLSVIPVVMLAGTMSLSGIVEAQGNAWFILAPIVGPIGLLTFFVAGLAELNRSPFDLPEAESEIVAGYHLEYSGMRFALFFLAEYANSFTLGAIASTLFLGGWHGPILPGYVWLLLKAYTLFVVMVWARGTLPRLRFDQLMSFTWKFLLPLTLVNVALAAGVRALGAMEWPGLLLLAINVVAVIVLYRLYTDGWRAQQLRGSAPILESITQGSHP